MTQGRRVTVSLRYNCNVFSWPGQLRANCFWWSLWTGTDKKAFARSVAAPGDMLICSSKNTTSGTAAAGSHCLIEFLIVSCHSPQSVCLLPWPDKKVKERCGGSHLSSPWRWQWFLKFLQGHHTGFESPFFFFCRGNSKGFHLACPIVMVWIGTTPIHTCV